MSLSFPQHGDHLLHILQTINISVLSFNTERRHASQAAWPQDRMRGSRCPAPCLKPEIKNRNKVRLHTLARLGTPVNMENELKMTLSTKTCAQKTD